MANLLKTDTYVAGTATGVAYGSQIFGVFNKRTGSEVERCGNYQDALARVTFHNNFAKLNGIADTK